MEQEPKPSHTGRWVTLVAVALPLLYVLSFPWVDFYRMKQGWATRSLLIDGPTAPPVVRAYWKPIEWLLCTPLGPCLWKYHTWCNGKAGNPMLYYIE